MGAKIFYLTMALALALAFSLAAVMVLAEPAQANSGWWNTDWEYRQKLTFNNSGQSEDLVNFPILVKLDSTRIDYGKTQDSGQDIRFVDSDDETVLSHEIEEWDETGDSWVWVKVPRIDGSSSTDHIYMYYGNSGSPDGQHPTTVWDSKYKMVQHLKDKTTGTTGDSTSNSNDGTKNVANPPNEVDGKIGKGQDFVDTGNNEWIRVTHRDEDELRPEHICLEAWIKFDQPDDVDITLVSKLESEAGYGLYQAYGEAGYIEWYVVEGSGTYQEARSGIGTGWHYIVGTYDGEDVRIFVNGNLKEVNSTPSGPIDYKGYTADLFLGADPVGNSPSTPTLTGFDGQMDEVRISDQACSEDWVKAQYLSMTDSFVTYGGAAAPGGGGCFIATAAYGSYLDSHVETLRDFRDSYMVTNPVGSALVSAYYKLSPPVADFIDDNPTLKPIVRAGLMPAVAMSTVALNTNSAEKIAIVGSLLLISILLIMWWRQRSRSPHTS